jgi:hypothetical protein
MRVIEPRPGGVGGNRRFGGGGEGGTIVGTAKIRAAFQLSYPKPPNLSSLDYS